jgi:hypothetical protein
MLRKEGKIPVPFRLVPGSNYPGAQVAVRYCRAGLLQEGL